MPRHDELRPADHAKPTAFAIMDRALELGINFFDTANVYGWQKGEGVTEQIIGRWFAQGGGRREKIVLATKVYGDMGDWPERARLSALPHPPRLRGQPAPPADRPHRPLPDAPRRPRARRGRRSGRRWSCSCSRARCSTSAAATSPAGTSRRRNEIAAARATSSAWCREQSLYNLNDAHGRAGGAPRLPGATASA